MSYEKETALQMLSDGIVGNHVRPELLTRIEDLLKQVTINKLQDINIQRAYRWHGGGLQCWTPLEWAGAMCGEAGEAANAAKKLKRLVDNVQSINEGARHYATLQDAKKEVSKECADTILYALLLMAAVEDMNPEETLREIFNKKSEEYGFPERL